MTEDQRREYRREWNRKNKEKIKEYKHNSAIKKAIQEIESGKVRLVTRIEYDGQETAS